ncbi:amidophosphoribosyltransferase [Treponema zioleckii]|uniref:amidophosphoribosyltransferase n=1 Tax=Treponema zioleckii TaxID=331680 RepID=UPI00168AD09C|nr:amidophosphoribosyltransferase [Treponema zioleckii]
MGLHDECGVVGIYGPENASALTYFGLVSLQHRGQESAGIAVSDGEKIHLKKEMGLVGDIFTQTDFEKLKGNMAIGHVRYATAGGRTIENAQPFLNTFKAGSIALAHNGQLVNHAELREMLENFGCTFSSSTDSEVILKLIVRKFIENGGKLGTEKNLMIDSIDSDSELFINAVKQAVKEIKGSFALCIMTETMMIGVRDPNGIRPLCLGKIPDEEKSFILASESCAIDAMNGTFVRDVAPGEIVVITKDGIKSILPTEKAPKCTCIFEYVYFARPDSVIDSIAVQEARIRMGEVLAQESSSEADCVVGVPDSGIGAALGYARASGIPYVTGIIKNKYIGRTFIAPTQKEREKMVFVKLNAISSDLSGKRVVVIDDSIVRGTTSHRLVQILRRAGAKEVHFRVSSPPVKFPCHLGIDTPSKNELISSTHELEEIRKEIGADTLAFISLSGMKKALGENGFCEGCFSGSYPV